MPRRRQFLTHHDAKPAKRQHTKPCFDCPWARAAFPGWLGSMSADEWVALAHGEGSADCHTVSNQNCAGLAIYRSNVCKDPRAPNALRLPADRALVFGNPMEFKKHHTT